MATAYKPNTRENRELDSDVDAFIKKMHATIQDARGQMTDEEAAKADAEAKTILNRATSAAKSPRHTA
ncbi:MAG: hypothetical protein WBZ11_01220 [Candidatus Sulfotelmatobacter sp.]